MILSVISIGILMLIKWQGKQLVPTQAAYHEMIDLQFDLYDVLDVLERGYDCERSKRAKWIVEKCLRRKGKTYKVVAAESTYLGSPAWRIIHVGRM